MLVVASSNAMARWATFADATSEILDSSTNITVNADGTTETIVTEKIKILNERGRDANAKMSLLYNFDSSKLEILEAKTIVGDQEYVLPASLIEDKPLASAVQGFDQTHQVLLAFPNVMVGSIVSLKYKIILFKPDIPGFYENMISLVNTYIQKGTMQVSSALPLYINVNNPNNYLTVNSGRKNSKYTLEIKLNKPIFIDIMDEKNPLINPKEYPWVFIATTDNWTTFAKNYSLAYTEILQQKLPDMYQTIVDQAQNVSDPIQKIELVAALLNENIQYMGDWQTTNGRHIPQALAATAAKRLGDCKDFSTGMVAILQKLGFKANVVLVRRGEGIYDTNKIIKLPGSFHFNHAMVRVEVGNRVLWVDPTNFFSIADKVLSDIGDRKALVLDATNNRLEQIPLNSPEDNVIITTREFDLRYTDLVTVNASMELLGLSAVSMTGAQLSVAQETIDNYIIAKLGDYYNIVEKSVTAPNLGSRVVTDLIFKASYKEKNMVMQTNAGDALPFVNNYVLDNYIVNPEHVSDIYLGIPRIIQDKVILNNIKVVNTKSLDYALQSPWVDVMRKVVYKKDSVILEQKITIKSSWIYNNVTRSKKYQDFTMELAKNFKNGVLIVFSNRGN